MITKLNEVFYGVSGELGLICPGQWMTFVRFAGCNLNCSYCDTLYARTGGTRCDTELLVEYVAHRPTPSHVLFTGGEPMLQPEALIHMAALFQSFGRIVSVETNGTFPLNKIDKTNAVKMWVIDYKLDQSWETNRAFHQLPGVGRVLIKFVIKDESQYSLVLKEIIPKIKSERNGSRVLRWAMSPSIPDLPPRALFRWMLQDKLWLRSIEFNCQIHKLCRFAEIERVGALDLKQFSIRVTD